MAGQFIEINGAPCFIDYHDGEGSAVVNGRLIRWEFHEYLGPLFLRADGYTPLKKQPSEHHGVWPHFTRWMKRYEKKRKTAKASEIISA